MIWLYLATRPHPDLRIAEETFDIHAQSIPSAPHPPTVLPEWSEHTLPSAGSCVFACWLQAV